MSAFVNCFLPKYSRKIFDCLFPVNRKNVKSEKQEVKLEQEQEQAFALRLSEA
jgi:hypothetical protein